MHSYDDLLSRSDAPPGSAWGLFGPNDQLGTLNFLGSEQVIAGAACIRRGAVFNLDLPLDAFDPPLVRHRPPPKHRVVRTSSDVCDDWLDDFNTQGSSQIDGLRHMRHPDYGFYNGVADTEIREGSPDLGIHHWTERGIVGKGVLIDVARYLESSGSPIDCRSSQAITAADLDAAVAEQGVDVTPGTIVIIRTGFVNFVLNEMTVAERLRYSTNVTSPGLEQSHETLSWLWNHRVPLVAVDNLAVEALPAAPDSPFLSARERAGATRTFHSGMLHRVAIPLLGLALGELWNLEPLARDCSVDGIWEFLVVAKPLAIVGGVASPANAVAIK